MIKKIWNYAFGTTFRKGASILTILTFGSYLLGLVRDMLFSRTFGADKLLDVYNAAFVIPDILLNVFVAGALMAAFVPIFTHLNATGEEKEAQIVASTMLTAAPLAIGIISILAAIFMPQLTRIVAPGFDSAQKDLLIEMSRFMLISPIIFALSNTIGSMLVSYEKFTGYGLSPLLYNLGIIAGIPLTKIAGPNGLVLGVICGALLHLASRVIALKKTKFAAQSAQLAGQSHARLALSNFKNPHFLKILKLMIPRMAGQPIEQLTFFIFTSMASSLAVGGVSMMSFARNFQSVPVSLFGISFATAVFSSLSRKAALNSRDGFLYHFKETAKMLAITTVISGIFFYFFGELTIRILLGGGKFTEEQIVQTGSLLATFAFAIPAEGFIHLLARAFYALKDTWTPLIITLPGLAAIYGLAKFFAPTFGLNALPLSFAAVLTIEVIALFALLKLKIQKLKPDDNHHLPSA